MTEFFNSFESVFLKLEWLNGFIEYLLCLLNIDTKSAFGSALNFFFIPKTLSNFSRRVRLVNDLPH